MLFIFYPYSFFLSLCVDFFLCWVICELLLPSGRVEVHGGMCLLVAQTMAGELLQQLGREGRLFQLFH